MHVTAQHTQTLTHTQGGGGEFRGCVCISGRSSGSFCALLEASEGVWGGGGGGKTGGILSPRAWVGSSSSQGGRREEEMKPLAFVAGLGIKDGKRTRRGTECEGNTPASVGVCA